MSGEIEYLTVNEKWESQLKAINQYTESLGINKLRYNRDVEAILALTKIEIAGMSENECIENAFILTQYAAIIQKEINEHSIKLTWATHNLNVMIGKVASNYGTKYTSFEERKLMALNDNPYIKALNDMVLQASMRVKSLDQLGQKIISMSTVMTNLYYSKRKINA